MKDINWFKNEVAPYLTGYEIQYRFYSNGDFGPLTQIRFESLKKGGTIEFWGLNWLGIFLYDHDKDDLVLNVLLEPHETEKKELYLGMLQELLLDNP
ncbi:hypothetical protein [Bacteroides sp.]|uniref:hypothetical protein n=1 Tax=Bacteroides sp. TaxID=29523 RepID=UPI0025C195E9|nr:hypothetical protein [Bacteroides sp.]